VFFSVSVLTRVSFFIVAKARLLPHWPFVKDAEPEKKNKSLKVELGFTAYKQRYECEDDDDYDDDGEYDIDIDDDD